MASWISENSSTRAYIRVHRIHMIRVVILMAVLLVLGGASVNSLHLTMVTSPSFVISSERSHVEIYVACYRSGPDKDVRLSYGRLPVHLPGAGIESITSFPDGTISAEYDGQTFKHLPMNDNSTGLYYCEGSKGDQTTRVYGSILNALSWFYQGSWEELMLTKTINKGEYATLFVEKRRSGSTRYASWYRISHGVATNSTEYYGLTAVTIPPSQAKHGDVYAVVDSTDSLSDNKFTLIRLIVRGCVAGKWGPPGCGGVCDLCYNGGVCDDKTGDCICPPGFMGPNCLTVCPIGSFGWDCEYRCVSDQLFSCYETQFGLPDPFGITCISGLGGSLCHNGCPFGRFGAGCLQQCHCLYTSAGCDRFTAVCDFGGCAEGWSGTNCQIPDVCPVGYYGLNCVSKCHCYNNAACDKYTGYCSVGCAPGFTCVSRQCEPGYFGEDCSQGCRCLYDRRCDGITGYRPSVNCLQQFQTDGTGTCQFVLPVLSQPPEVIVQSTSAIVFWKAWGSHPMDAGDGPIIGYTIYRSNHSATTNSWIRAGYVSASYQPPIAFSFETDSLQQLTVYNFSVAAVREGKGGEGSRSPETTIETKPIAMESVGPAATTAGSNVGLIAAVCVLFALILIVVVVDYLRFRRLSRRWRAKNQPTEDALNMVVFDNPVAKEETSRMSEHVEGCEDVENAKDCSLDSAYKDVAQPWTDSLTIPIDRLSIGYKVVGTGHFGEVRLTTLWLEDGQSKAAVKQLKSNSSKSDRRRFMEEY
ncbi:tyrosine-protein kinase receptor Tie-2-like [Patiria miniata]|uniref:Uncharacterized protein n=1 Tax=Patiria miniata TaxID=46514 RepID=A0A914B058_PATMI|nr:tyrosine-protein kinase receptor Tie-2-like [Patiria miniata]